MRLAGWLFRLALLVLPALGAPGADAWGQTETISVELDLVTGGALSGLVVDATDFGLVIVHEQTPYAFAWDEVETPSAYRAKRALRALARGGQEHLWAEDHFELGNFALERGNATLARKEFDEACALDAQYEAFVHNAFERHRTRCRSTPVEHDPFEGGVMPSADGHEGETPQDGLTARLAALDKLQGVYRAEQTSGELRQAVRAVYDQFGAQVVEVMGKRAVRLESEHFLIWTDWDARTREHLVPWCEAMYGALCRQFGLDPAQDIFLAKCPVFCWRTRGRFLKFARLFDGYDGREAVGFSRSIADNGHVHLVLLQQGCSPADLDRFACTLVHEGTHAFVHRLYAPRLLPPWVNEGLAECMAEEVLKDRCPAGEKAALLSRQYARYGWSIGSLLEDLSPLQVHQYPLAHSLVARLRERGQERFAGFIRSLKEGKNAAEALSANYDGLTPAGLEADWRAAVRSAEDSSDG